MLVRRVLPRLRQEPVVPVDVVRVEAQVSLLDVLLDWVARLLGRDLHLGRGLLGDLADEVERPVGVAERDVVPPGDGFPALLLDEEAVLGRGAGALAFFFNYYFYYYYYYFDFFEEMVEAEREGERRIKEGRKKSRGAALFFSFFFGKRRSVFVVARNLAPVS